MRYFSDENYFIRPVGEGDLPLLAEHRNSQLTWNGLTDIFPKWPHQQKKWLDSMGDTNMYFMVESVNPEIDYDVYLGPIGLVRITDVDNTNQTACVGLDVLETHRGRGHAAKIMRLIQKYCFKYLNMHHLWLLVFDDNIPAIRTYRKTGFRLEGVLREHLYRDGLWHDYLYMGILKEEWERDNTSV